MYSRFKTPTGGAITSSLHLAKNYAARTRCTSKKIVEIKKSVDFQLLQVVSCHYLSKKVQK